MYSERECETGDYCLIQPAIVGLLWYCWTYGRHLPEVAAYTEQNGIVHFPSSTKIQPNSHTMPTIKFPSRITAAARLSDSSSHSSQSKSQRQSKAQKQRPKHRQSTPCILSQKEQEMNETLQEALTCISCPIHLSKADMDRDTQSGKYDPSRDPPFLTSSPRSRRHSRSASSDASGSYDHDHGHGNNSDYASSSPDDHDHDHDEKDMDIDMAEDMEQQDRMECDDDDVSPLDTTPNPHPRATYASLTTSAQRQQYQTRVLEALSDLIGPLGCTNDDWDESYSPPPPPQTLSNVQGVVDEDDIRFACYRVDYHIHLHERARSSTLSMCRDIDDVWQLRGWQTEVRQLDREVLRMDPPDDKKEEEEDGLLAVHQLAVWRRAWRARERRVHEVRKTWDGIVAERRRQRAKFLRKRRDHGGKIRFYTRQEGNRVLLREFSL